MICLFVMLFRFFFEGEGKRGHRRFEFFFSLSVSLGLCEGTNVAISQKLPFVSLVVSSGGHVNGPSSTSKTSTALSHCIAAKSRGRVATEHATRRRRKSVHGNLFGRRSSRSMALKQFCFLLICFPSPFGRGGGKGASSLSLSPFLEKKMNASCCLRRAGRR